MTNRGELLGLLAFSPVLMACMCSRTVTIPRTIHADVSITSGTGVAMRPSSPPAFLVDGTPAEFICAEMFWVKEKGVCMEWESKSSFGNGAHQLTVQLAGFDDQSQTVTVRGGYEESSCSATTPFATEFREIPDAGVPDLLSGLADGAPTD